MRKVLFVGDGVTPTGFATVLHNIIDNLPDTYEVHHLAINYWGDPHDYTHKIYPAATPRSLQMGDVMGYTRLEEFVDKGFDAIFILNDIWVLDRYLDRIKELWKDAKEDIPKIVVYYPVQLVILYGEIIRGCKVKTIIRIEINQFDVLIDCLDVSSKLFIPFY